MRVSQLPRALCEKAALPLLLLSLTACSEPKADDFVAPAPAKTSEFKVSGKVTYKGQSVPYGYVLFFGQKGGIHPKSGRTAPPMVGKIGVDGRYEIEHPILGPVSVCVATDPDVDPSVFFQSGSYGPSLPNGPPNAGPPAAVPPGVGAPPGGPPGLPGGQPGMPPVPPGAPMPKLPLLPPTQGPQPGAGQPPQPIPETEKLTAEQKKMLKEIHEKYGTLNRSPLAFVVAGKKDQTFNIELAPKK